MTSTRCAAERVRTVTCRGILVFLLIMSFGACQDWVQPAPVSEVPVPTAAPALTTGRSAGAIAKADNRVSRTSI